MPLPDIPDLAHKVVVREDRWVALPLGHPLAARSIVAFTELADEPAVALPSTAGPLRDFWLALDHRTRPPRIAAEAETTDEALEAVAAGHGVVLLAAGNAGIYARDDITFRPVSGLAPGELAVTWRASDRRPIIRTVVAACTRCLCREPR
jgi:DNA-binding transcriptional LysR family regulator